MCHNWITEFSCLPAGALQKALSQLYCLHGQKAHLVGDQACAAGVHCIAASLSA